MRNINDYSFFGIRNDLLSNVNYWSYYSGKLRHIFSKNLDITDLEITFFAHEDQDILCVAYSNIAEPYSVDCSRIVLKEYGLAFSSNADSEQLVTEIILGII